MKLFSVIKYQLLLVLALCSSSLLAQQRSESEAQQVASQWFASRGSARRISSAKSNAKSVKQTDYQAAWCFKQGKEFVLVGKNKQQPSILGYGNVNRENMPDMLQKMLSFKPTNVQHYPLDGAKWKPVEPLLTTLHYFGSPYNDLCPYYTDENGVTSKERCVAGCVAIAMEQILAYYKRIYTLQDTLKGWATPHYTIADILPGETVDARLIRDSYKDGLATKDECEATAKLMYYLGVASKMQWGLSASGTNTWRLVEPLKKAFGLKYVHHLDSYQYAPVAYWNFLANEISEGRPVYYAGSAMNLEGHAIVLDGIDGAGMFHINWGFAGDYDGYFRLDVLSLREPENEHKDFNENGFFCNQEALVVCPDKVACLPPDTLQRTGREVCIDSLWCIDEPSTQCATRVKMIIRNTSDQCLTTPLALLQNAPTDTAAMQQAQWLVFTGRTLMPNESDTLLVHAQFVNSGESILSVTPDGEQTLCSFKCNVSDDGTNTMQESADIHINILDNTTIDICQPLANSANCRAAQNYLFDLTDDVTQVNAHKLARIYLSATTDTIVSMRFSQLVPGHTYTYRLRRNWPVVIEKQFTMPTADGIVNIKRNDTSNSTIYFDIAGKQYHDVPTSANGVIIEKAGSKTGKKIIKK